MERKTEGKCRPCGGNIVEKINREYDPALGPMVIGPGSRHQIREVSKGFHCEQCGLKYEFVPKT